MCAARRARALWGPRTHSASGAFLRLGALRSGMDGPAPGASADAPAGMRVRSLFAFAG